MQKKNVLAAFLIKAAVFVLFGVLCFFNIFQKLDYRLYDSLSHLRKEPPQEENIMLVEIDDISIQELGEWPWSRDVIADALLRMKEFGADTAIFDIEYISPSKNGIAPAAEQNIANKVENTNQKIEELVRQLSGALSTNQFSPEEIPQLLGSLLDENLRPEFEDLMEYIHNHMSRDNDEYFARCIQFFGKAYLTVNHGDLGYYPTQEEIDYIKKRLLLDKNFVNDSEDLIVLGNDFVSAEADEKKGFTPAMHELVSRSYGVDFTNSVIDNDGVRRRMELLFAYDDMYLPQLSFGPYLRIVGAGSVTRLKNALIVHDVKNPFTGNTGDVKIPLDEHGCMLIDWQHGTYEEAFKHNSFVDLIRMDKIEENILACLNNIWANIVLGEDGFEMDYTLEAQDLIGLYLDISDMKNALLEKCTGYDEKGNVLDGISDEEYAQYFALRNEFYGSIREFLDKGYLDALTARLADIEGMVDQDVIDEIKAWFEEDFSVLEAEYNAYVGFYAELHKLYDGAYCILGNTATSTTDMGATPFQKKFMNVGIHANILNTLLTESFIIVIPWYIGFALAVIIAFAMLSFSGTSNALQNSMSFAIYLIFCLFFGGLFVFSKYYIQFIGTIFYLAVDLLAGIAYRFYESIKEKQFITQIAASFANKDTVEELRKNPEAFKTEGQKKTITALFSDIQKFSTLSESIGKMYGDEGPNKLIEILNEYLGQMSNEILLNNGNIDKYEGDAIISMFGAPDPMNSHTPEEWAYLCLDSAVRMKKVEVEFNRNHADLFKPVVIQTEKGEETIQLKPLQTRIGVNSGEAYVGLMGSKTETFSKLNYTMIGDTVNLASRLEGVNKAYNSWIMCSDSTWNMANTGKNEGLLTVRKLDQVRVVGRSTPVQLYNVIGFTNELSSTEKQKIDIFHAALEKYLARDFMNAGKLFMQANALEGGDPTSLVFAERCKNFLEKGVPEAWDGVINMTSK